MQRLRLSSNLHVGLALGIATAGVILALTGCAVTTGTAQPDRSLSGGSAKASASLDSVSLEQFSETERERIVAVQAIVAEAAAEHDLDPALINAVIWVESRFNPKAKSSAGARGLMQLMPATAAYLAKRMGESSARAYDPQFNVRAGALYLAEMLAKFGDEQYAVAAYHAGPGNVKKWVEAGQRFPDYSEAYVAKVMDARTKFVGVEIHGRTSGARMPLVAPTSEADDFDDGLTVPDVRTLPDAAQIHGVDRVIYEQPEPEPQPEPQPEPEPEPQIDAEPVFEVHPELDRDANAAPPGWTTRTPAVRPKPTPRPRPPQPKPEPPQETPQETGIGVLPDL